MLCPKTEMSWCKYQANITNKTYKYKTGIHNKICKTSVLGAKWWRIVKKVSPWKNTEYEWVCQWCYLEKKCPKDKYVGRSTLEMGVDSAIISFNFGESRLLDVFKEYGLQDALYTNTFCRKMGISRIKESCQKESCTERIWGQGKRKGGCCVWTWYPPFIITLFFVFYVVLAFKTTLAFLIVGGGGGGGGHFPIFRFFHHQFHFFFLMGFLF